MGVRGCRQVHGGSSLLDGQAWVPVGVGIAKKTPRWKLLGSKDLHGINENQNAFFVLLQQWIITCLGMACSDLL